MILRTITTSLRLAQLPSWHAQVDPFVVARLKKKEREKDATETPNEIAL